MVVVAREIFQFFRQIVCFSKMIDFALFNYYQIKKSVCEKKTILH